MVVTDRFDSSTWAMQVRGEKNPKLEKFFWQCREAVLGTIEPDLYIILDIEPNGARSRRVDRMIGEDRFDERAKDFQIRTRNGFIEFAKTMRSSSVVISAREGPDEIHEKIVAALKKRFRI
jgi:thymidylate kinase